MSLKFFSSLVLIFFIGCSTTPIKYDKPIKANDYKNYYRLKEQIKPAETNKVEIKKTRPLIPTRRVRKTNTAPRDNTTPTLLPNTRTEAVEAKQDTGKSIMLYLIYLQAVIIAVFAYAILRRQKKIKKTATKTGELNL